MSIELTDEETLRYNRQIVLRGFDFDGQEALKSASVLIVGVGGLGCSVSQYLTAAGVGKLTLLDFDTVSLSNLQRQILHRDSTIGQPKVLSAKTTLNAINPHVQIDTVDALLEDKALAELISQHHLVMDCNADNGRRHGTPDAVEHSLHRDFEHHKQLRISVDTQKYTSGFVSCLFGDKDRKDLIAVKDKQQRAVRCR